MGGLQASLKPPDFYAVTDYMTKNPFLNALAGLLYIVLVVSGIFSSSSLGIEEPNILIPIAMLSLLVFSAAYMSFVFFYQPLMLFLEGQKKEAVQLFLKTLGAFAVSAALLVSVGLCLQAYL